MSDFPSDAFSPAELIGRARRGEADGVDAFLRRFQTVARQHAERQMGHRVRRFVDPEAVAQAALEDVLSHLGSMDPDAGEREVLRRLWRCVRSQVLQAVRKNKEHRGESCVPEDAGESVESMGVVTRDDQRAWIRRLVSQLPEAHREIVRLCALEELSFVEAGQRLGLSADTVRKRYSRASGLLRAAVDRCAHE